MSDQRDTLLSLTQCLFSTLGSSRGWRTFVSELHGALSAESAAMLTRELGDVERDDRRDDAGQSLAIAAALTRVAAAAAANPATRPARAKDKSHVGLQEPDLSLMVGLLPYLRQALALEHQIAESRQTATELSSALDRMDHGLIVVRPDGRARFVNACAAEILKQKDGVTLIRERLRCARQADTTTLAAAIAAAAGSQARGTTDCLRLTLRRPAGRSDLQLSIVPTGRNGTDATPAALVFLSDPDKQLSPSIDRLREAFGLTRAEARLAAALATGDRLDQVASRLDVGLNTVRSQLKGLFAKTKTKRQAELIRRLLMSRSWVRE